MRKYGLIGYPLGHSFSQKYFTEKFRTEHLFDCSYQNFPLKDINSLKDLISNEPALEGLNVTIPHKADVIKFLDNISPEAKDIGAVNVIKIKREGANCFLYGFNSDVYGFTESALPYIKHRKGKALVLGTGGSSRAVCYGLEKTGMKVIRVSRTRKEGIITYSEINRKLMNETDLIVNTTPLGMHPDIDGKPELDYDLLNNRHILYDLVYNPGKTAFLMEGEKRGCLTVSGLRMLHLQAEKAWEIWNDSNL